MEFVLKNIILYDEFGGVSGFAEFRIRRGQTEIKVRHNLTGKGLSFGIIANGETAGNFELTGSQLLLEHRGRIDAEMEIFCVITAHEGNEVKTLASGVVNETKLSPRESEPEAKTEKREEIAEVATETGLAERYEAVQELDEVLRKMCVIDEHGRGQCESCPYREHFFDKAIADDEVVV